MYLQILASNRAFGHVTSNHAFGHVTSNCAVGHVASSGMYQFKLRVWAHTCFNCTIMCNQLTSLSSSFLSLKLSCLTLLILLLSCLDPCSTRQCAELGEHQKLWIQTYRLCYSLDFGYITFVWIINNRHLTFGFTPPLFKQHDQGCHSPQAKS